MAKDPEKKLGDVPEPPAPRKSELDTALRHQVYLEKVASGLAEDMAGKALQFPEGLARWLGGQEVELTELSAIQLQKLVTATVREQATVLFEAVEELTPKLTELAEYEGEFQLKALLRAAKDVEVKSLKAGQVYAAARKNPIGATGDLLEAFTKTWAEKEVKAATNVIRQGWTHGLTNKEIQQAIRGTRAAKYKDGLAQQTSKNVEAVVRTSVQHVAQTAREELWARNADIIKYYSLVATLDGNTTARCRALDGQRFKVGEGPVPPLHVRCRTTTVPEIEEKFSVLLEGTKRASKDGPVDAKLTYYGWLKDQPEAFQDSVLGPTRGKLLRDGGLTAEEFARLSLDKNFDPITLDEMRKLEPAAFERAGL